MDTTLDYTLLNPFLRCQVDSYTYREICGILEIQHGTRCSLRTLHRILRKLNLRRNMPDDRTLTQFLLNLESELQGSGTNLGCRAMGKRLSSRYGVHIPRAFVLEGQRMLDPDGVEMRRRHQLRRRLYLSKGPNFSIHVDQYDKLRAYGFCIHGGIDGFSRRILWLRVASTNRDPQVVASYFMDYVTEIEGVPLCIQMDRGTENVMIANIQTAFHSEYAQQNEKPCVIKSTSPHNQRIERFWRTLFNMMSNFWVDRLHQLVSEGVLDCTSPLQIECLRFCFTSMIQAELDDVKIEWNQHRTRTSRHVSALPGKPDFMYFLPQLYDTHNYCTQVPLTDIDDVKQEFTTRPRATGCSAEMEEVCRNLMAGHNKEMPSSVEDGIELFRWFCSELE